MNQSISRSISTAKPIVLACWVLAAGSLCAQPANPFLKPAGTPSSPGVSVAPTAQPIAQSTSISASPATDDTKVLAVPAASSVPLAAAAASLAGGVALRFDNADIVDVVQTVLGDILKLDYLLDPSVQGRVTFRSSANVNPEHLRGILETALASQGFVIAKQGSMYRVTPDANMNRVATFGKASGPSAPVMQVIPLMFLQAQQLAITLKTFASPQASVTPDPTNKYLIIVDRAEGVEKLSALVSLLDADYLRNINIQVFKLENANPADIAKELDGIFKTSGLFNAQNTETTKIFTLPIGRMNAVLVAAANSKVLELAQKWIKTLDLPLDRDLDSFVHVYPVQSTNAAHLAGLLQQMFGGAAGSASAVSASSRPQSTSTFGQSGTAGATTQPGASNVTPASAATSSTVIARGNTPSPAAVSVSDGSAGLAAGIQVIADEVSNSLIIRASAADFQRIRRVIEKIDKAPKQVLIQVVVAEISLNDTLQYGVEWWLKSNLSSNGRSWTSRAGLDGLIKTPTTPGVVTGLGGGFNYTVLNSSSQVIGLLNLLGQDTKVNLLSAPHVLASDGKTARVEIGNDEPVVTQTVQTPTTLGGSPSTSNSVQYRPTGILLEVRPTISASGVVSLSVSQEVSNRAGSVSVGGSDYPNFSKRRVTTDVAIEEGKTVVIAGLIEDKGDGTSIGLPGLKDIPVFGALFGTNKKVTTKTELLISITPYIVDSQSEADRLSGAFQATLANLNDVVKKGRERFQLNDRPPALEDGMLKR